MLRDSARMPCFRGRGLLARILYSVPPNTVGHRRVGAPAVPEHIATSYHDTLRALALSLADLEHPAELALSPDADQLMLRLESDLEPRLRWRRARPPRRLGQQAQTARGWDRPFSTETVEGAARLGHYYLAHALAVLDLMHADPVVDGARTILGWLERTGTLRFTRHQLFTGISRARFRKTTDLDQPLQLLEQHGYLRRGPTPPPTGGRPGTPPYDVNPHAIDVQSP